MAVLGLNHGELNSSAAITHAGKVLAGAPEERFSREKRTKAFPHAALSFCLESCDLDINTLDAVAQSWNPAAYWASFNPLLSANRVRREDYLYTVPDNLFQHTRRETPDWVQLSMSSPSTLPPVYFVNHHTSHAATAFFTSPFDRAAVFTADWRGELQTGVFGVGEGQSLRVSQDFRVPNSLGMLYATFTQLLGYIPDSDEWKVMALSAYDVDSSYLERALWSTIRLTPDGWFELDQSYYCGNSIDRPTLYSQKLVDLLGSREGEPGAPPDEWHFAVAKAMQSVVEAIAIHALRSLYVKTRQPNLVLGGGFFMNSVLNGKIQELTDFQELFVPFAPADVGNSLGSALYVEHMVLDRPREPSPSSSFIGPSFSNDAIAQALERRQIRHTRLDRPASDIASLILENGIIAYFDGAMEFGERALGHRSILADPRDRAIKDRINALVKYREAYRPFAPVCTLESASKFFDLPLGAEIPFMEKVIPIKPQYQKELAAVVHTDGSARLQTLRKEENLRLHEVLLLIEQITGFPILLNTSLNVNGEPIACTPDDALTTFFKSGLHALVLGDFLVTK